MNFNVKPFYRGLVEHRHFVENYLLNHLTSGLCTCFRLLSGKTSIGLIQSFQINIYSNSSSLYRMNLNVKPFYRGLVEHLHFVENYLLNPLTGV